MIAAIYFLGVALLLMASKETFMEYLRYRLAIKKAKIEAEQETKMAQMRVDELGRMHEDPIIGIHNQDVQRARGG